jgi:hypothetical protein
VHYTYLYRSPALPIRLPIRRRLPHGIDFFGGSAFWCLAAEHARFVLNETDRLQRFLRRSLIPDEIFFQTALLNSRYRTHVRNDSLTFAKWESGAPSPAVLGDRDIDQLMAAPEFFARKFDLAVDSGVLDCLDELKDATCARH